MRTRRELLVGIVGAAGAPLLALEQKDGKVWRVGFLGGGLRPTSPGMDVFGGLLQGLREQGYVEGKTFEMEWRFAGGRYESLPNLAAELTRIPVDVMVADGAAATHAAQSATRTIPIVFTGVVDPVGDGLVPSLARPGGNTTGSSLFLTDTVGKQMELLVSIVPGLSRLGVLFNPGNSAAKPVLKRVEEESVRFKLAILRVAAQTETEVRSAIPVMASQNAGALLWIRDSFLNSQRRLIAELALTHRMPTMGGSRNFVEAGGLMTYSQNGWESTRRAATYVSKIFKGANPGDLPVEQPTKLELVINRKTANALGLKIPPELLVLAESVIE
jgi:putative tryptophan/tyrosine transport system substrate-binding protein